MIGLRLVTGARTISAPLAAVLLLGAATLPPTPATGPLRVSNVNPRYFADGNGQAVYLTGSHTWNSLQDVTRYSFLPNLISQEGYDAYLDFLVSQNHNFIRMWFLEHAWDEDEKAAIAPHPWPRTGRGIAADGLPKFDLERSNQAFYDRLRQRVMAAGDRGIYVSIMLFGGMWGTEHQSTWKGHPFNANNNVNGINGDRHGNDTGNEIYTLLDPRVTAIQKAHARKVIDTLNDLDNVLYEIANEVRAFSTPWQYEMLKFVKDYQATKPKQHPVGMTGHASIPNSDLLNSPADWISPSQSGGDYKSNPPAATGSKVILIDTDHLWGEGGDPGWVWKSFTRGLQPIWMERLMMGEGDLPDADVIRDAMGRARSFAQRINLVDMAPHPELASTGYCLANPGVEYLVYQPEANKPFVVELKAGSYAYTWFQVSAGSGRIKSTGKAQQFTAPFDGGAVLHIKAQ